ncbi:MAG: clostripain-related cysteine peptidase, partial [Armatimonadota bacterium]
SVRTGHVGDVWWQRASVLVVVAGWMACHAVLADARADWTLMAYLSGDGELEGAAVGYVQMLASVGGSDRVHVAVQLDRREGGDATPPDFADTRRLIIEQSENGPGGIAMEGAEELGEVDMASGEALAAFVRWVRERCPARRYGLVVMGHGSGLVELPHPFVRVPPQVCGLCHDETSGTQMSAAELGRVLRSLADEAGRPPVDVLCLDACLTALLEVVYELRGGCRFVTASEYVMLTPGAPWDQILRGLVAWPDMSAREFAGNYVRQAAGYWARVPEVAVTHSAIDVPRAAGLAERLGRLSERLASRISESAPAITYARASSQSFGSQRQYVDLGQFVGILAERHPDEVTRELAREVAADVDAAVLAEYHCGTEPDGGKEPTGLSVFFPPNLSELPEAYRTSAGLARETGWGEFLETYLGHVRGMFAREAA